MKVPRDLSGEELVKVLCRNWAYTKIHQEGSHVVLETDTPSHHRIAVPSHKSLRVGTLNAILKAVANHKNVSRDHLLRSL
ncbi:MAG TPA: type II toxin-antitoxin system HicA family toxin [Verrucomicrobiae bacterium]|nr:type II toxin-antitoxin system HicA family toxin [Verrucomicrobiae bacterium]